MKPKLTGWLALLVWFAHLSGLVSPAQTAAANGSVPSTATVHVYRAPRYTASRDIIPFYVDNTQVASIQNGRYFSIELDPGRHRVRSQFSESAGQVDTGDDDPGVDINVESGKVYFIRVHIEGCWGTCHIRTTQVDLEKAQQEMTRLKPLEPGYLRDRERAVAETVVFTANGPPPQSSKAGFVKVQSSPAQTAVAAEVIDKPIPQLCDLNLQTQPGGVQVYVDDKFKGETSEQEGRLVVEKLEPRSHRLRLRLPGYKEWNHEVTLAAGETLPVSAKLEPAGPKPLSVEEVEEALTNGISPKRMTALVKQFGVDFALTPEAEQRLREKGADSDLLLAIATNKK